MSLQGFQVRLLEGQRDGQRAVRSLSEDWIVLIHIQRPHGIFLLRNHSSAGCQLREMTPADSQSRIGDLQTVILPDILRQSSLPILRGPRCKSPVSAFILGRFSSVALRLGRLRLLLDSAVVTVIRATHGSDLSLIQRTETSCNSMVY